jgi:tRNA 5-methylaminomethyl-2-thiouridine biosynthesis bifunctional protein
MAEETSPLAWTDDGQPRSRLFGDVYFSAEDGLAETRAVFLRGCGLPDAWVGRRRFTVGELGFGTGLNIAALLALWSATRPPGGRLHVFTVEAHPVTAAEAARALSRWPELAPFAQALADRWPGRAPGIHRAEFPDLGAIVDVAICEASEALAGWQGRADSWFLDGFSPALNPAMWTDELMGLVAARSAPGAVAATFTVAGQVRRALSAAGFSVEKRPGYGRKRERLVAVLPGEATETPAPARVAVVGAGVAGAAAARALNALGAEPLVFDAEGLASGASGNPAALVTPRLDAGLGPPARLFAEAFRRAVVLYEAQPDSILARGALQLALSPRDEARFAKLAGSGLFEPGALGLLSAAQAAAALGEPAPAALRLEQGLVITPRSVLSAWAPGIRRAAVARIAPAGDGFVLRDASEATLAQADAVVIAAGLASRRLLDGLPLSAVRGQASLAAWPHARPPAAAFGGYVIPTPDGLLFGATHDRGDEARDVRAADHVRNLAALAEGLPRLAGRLAGVPLEGRAAIRVATPDHLPVAGPAPQGPLGVAVLAGFGARGFTLAPLLAEHVAAGLLGAPSPLARPLADAVDPQRFDRRAARRYHARRS